MEAERWDAAVIGGSAAGLSAALMLGRARRKVLVIDEGLPRNRFASHMHGVLGNEGVDPAAFVARGRSEAATYGVAFVEASVQRVDDLEGGIALTLRDGRVLSARAAIVATGLTDRLPDIPGLAKRWGVSVLHCPYCHGWEVRDQRLGVLTTSPLGMHQAQLVRQWSDDLVVFAAGLGEIDAGTERRLRSRGVELVSSPVVEVVGQGTAIDAVRTADGQLIAVDALFTASALEPNDGFLSHLGLDRADNPTGSFLAVDPTGKTSHDRIWAIGNVSNPAATVPMAVGAGAMAGGMVNMALVTEEFDEAVLMGPASRVG